MTERRLLIGVGNPLRCDDGVGPAVARLLRGRLRFPAVEHHGEGLALLDAWQGYTAVIVIDATRSGVTPGTLRRFECGAARPAPDLSPAGLQSSSHLFGVAEAVALAGTLGRLPARLTLYGIEGAEFGHGAGLSPPVAAAVLRLAGRLAGTPLAGIPGFSRCAAAARPPTPRPAARRRPR